MSNIPVCAGEYESCDVCDGDDNGVGREETMPCAWRDRCVAFQAFIKDRNRVVEDYLTDFGEQYASAIAGDSRFVALCDAQIKKYGVIDGAINKAPGKPKHLRKKVSRKARTASAKAAKATAKKRRRELESLFQHFKMHLIENLDGRKFVPPKGIIVPGMLYSIDRSDTSGYIAIYCKKSGVKGVPVAQLMLRPKTVSYDIELPVEYTGYLGVGKATMRKIKPEHIENGRFKSVCKNMDKEGVALVAQTIAHLIRIDRIKLPKM
jgi:hypothetical protein